MASAPLLLLFPSSLIAGLTVLQKVSTSPVGIGNAMHKATSFGSGPCLDDKIRLPSRQIVHESELVGKPIAAFAFHAFADPRTHIPCAIAEWEALTVITAVCDQERMYPLWMPINFFLVETNTSHRMVLVIAAQR